MSAAEKLLASGVRVEGLAVRIGDRDILRGVDLVVEPGELVGLVGPNGAGKTTLLRAIAGYLPAARGAVRVAGFDPARLPARNLGRLLAQVPQSARLDLEFSCLDVVLMGRYPYTARLQRGNTAHDLAAARRALAAAGLVERADQAAGTLSGGERQRLLLARALAQDASLLLLDEPTANLDLRHRLGALELVREAVTAGVAAVAAVHDLELAARFCDRMVLLTDGSVLAAGLPADVLTAEPLAQAFGLRTATFPDPCTGALRISVLGPAAPQPR